MIRKLALMALISLVGLAGGCAREEAVEAVDPAETAWEELRVAWGEAETNQVKLELAENYLADFPDTDHSGSMAGAVAYYRGREMQDPEGAWNVLSTALGKIEDPEQRFEVSMEALDLADSVDIPIDIASVSGALAAARPLTFDENNWVAGTALDLEEWAVAEEHAMAAVEFATDEQYRADNPDREFTDAEVELRVKGRKASSLANAGWAAYNLGEIETAMARFADADAVGSVTYLDVPNTPLYTYWGRAALGEGDVDRAIDLLGAETVFGEDGAAAKPYLRQAYAARNGSEEGFEEFLWSTRVKHAKVAEDFELLDYEGNARSLSESNGKVTLLAFWFPT
jgi:tetratricopeptide (TPR) repeat protein